MKKKLKIKFWKPEKALAMQIIEQDGLPKRKEDNKVCIISSPFITRDGIALRGNSKEQDLSVPYRSFKSNQERDAYLNKMTQAITDELFTNNGELKVGEYCEVRDFDYEEWETRKLLAILPHHIEMPFIVERPQNKACVEDWTYARPLCKRIEPKVETNGEVISYTWEEE